MKRASTAMLSMFLVTATTAALPGCATDDVGTDEVELPDGDVGKADSDTELRVPAAETTLWVDKSIVRETFEGHDWLVLNGRTSRNLTGGFAFVLDDPYGWMTIESARTFEIRWSTSELATLLVGVNQFINLQLAPSPGRPDRLTGRVVARARMTDFSGTGSYIFTDVTPVVSNGLSVMRVQGSATSDLLEVRAEIGPDVLDQVAITDPRHFRIDLSIEQAIALAGSSTDLEISVRTATGTRLKRAKLAVVVKKLGLTDGDAYEVWPRPDCDDEVLACVQQAQAAGNTDLGSCGEVLDVNVCRRAQHVSVGEAEIADAQAQADSALTDPNGLRNDAVALVGTARIEALIAGVRGLIAERLAALAGVIYPSLVDRAVGLQAAIDGGFDEGYAHPLQFVPALTPVANDLVRAREIAADGLLGYLAGADLVHSEYGRPVIELARLYRSEHLAALRYFRLEAEPEVITGWPPHLFIGRWLGAYVEISVTEGSGELANVFFEID